MTINEIINDYTSGKTPVEETNAALKAANSLTFTCFIVPTKNIVV